MNNVCDPDYLWTSLMVVTASCAGLTLTGGTFLKGAIREYITEKIKNIEDIYLLDEQVFSKYITENIFFIVIMFLVSSVLLIPYLVADWHWGVYISYSLFYGTIISLIYFIFVYIYDFRKINEVIIPLSISQPEQIYQKGIISVGNADLESPVFITSNSIIDYQPLKQDLGWNMKGAYVLCVNTNGLQLKDAMNSKLFNAKYIISSLDQSSFAINNQIYPALVLPEIAKELKDELDTLFNGRVSVLIGPNKTDLIGVWWEENWPPRRKNVS